MTTAALRTAAYDAARALNWAEAADLYAQAIAAYPKSGRGDCLAQRDIANLSSKRDACLRMAQG